MTTTWVMQYRTKVQNSSEWGEWKNLPKTLVYSPYYTPNYFQFRAVVDYEHRAFVFKVEQEDD